MHPLNIDADQARVVEIKYINHRGQYRTYNVIPHSMTFNRNEWHKTEQWIMTATDVDRNVVREFAMQDIRSWVPTIR